jgi:hypothetical protein
MKRRRKRTKMSKKKTKTKTSKKLRSMTSKGGTMTFGKFTDAILNELKSMAKESSDGEDTHVVLADLSRLFESVKKKLGKEADTAPDPAPTDDSLTDTPTPDDAEVPTEDDIAMEQPIASEEDDGPHIEHR